MLDVGQLLTRGAERQVLEEHRQAIERLVVPKLTHGATFAVDLHVAGYVIGLCIEHLQCRRLVLVDIRHGENESKRRVRIAGVGAMLPSHRIPEHEIQLAAAAPETLLLRASQLIFIAENSRGGQRIGAEHDVVEMQALFAGAVAKRRLAFVGINIDERARQVRPDTDFIIDPAELFGDLPNTTFNEPVVAAEYRSGIHQRQRERGVRIGERYGPAFGHRHRHVHLASLAREVVIDERFRGARDPQVGQRLSKRASCVTEARWLRVAVTILQEIDDPAFVRPKGLDLAALSPLFSHLAIELRRVPIDPGRLGVTGEEDQLGMFRNERLEAMRKPSLLEDEILHQAQHRRAQRIVMRHSVDGRGARHAGTADALRTLNHGHVATGALQIIRGDQPVDAGAGNEYCGALHGVDRILRLVPDAFFIRSPRPVLLEQFGVQLEVSRHARVGHRQRPATGRGADLLPHGHPGRLVDIQANVTDDLANLLLLGRQFQYEGARAADLVFAHDGQEKVVLQVLAGDAESETGIGLQSIRVAAHRIFLHEIGRLVVHHDGAAIDQRLSLPTVKSDAKATVFANEGRAGRPALFCTVAVGPDDLDSRHCGLKVSYLALDLPDGVIERPFNGRCLTMSRCRHHNCGDRREQTTRS